MTKSATTPVIANARPAEQPVGVSAHVRRAIRQGLAGTYPSRYRAAWREPLDARLGPLLHPGVRILDVGAGASPFLPPERRPPDTHYVGLDVSLDELRRAPTNAYDEIVVGDAARTQPQLAGRFDVVVSWLALEHVAGVREAFAAAHGYLRPQGTLLAYLAGRNGLGGTLNRLLPHRLAVVLLGALHDRPADDVFPARYDHCTHSGLTAALRGWSAVDVQPIFAGGAYFGFARPLLALALGWEEWAYRTGRLDLAAYYLVEAQR